MIYFATTVLGEKLYLGFAYSAEINKSQEAPADSLTATFLSATNYPECKYIEVYTDENQLFFSGIIDEQEFKVTEKGGFFTIIARSKAAYLVDNEALPQTYKRPSLNIIFERHVQPYGFTSISGDESVFNNTIEVEKGMSEWDVLELFCSTCLNKFPIINADGSVDASGSADLQTIMFSNLDASGINYSSISQHYNRYKLISEIIVCKPYEPVYAAKIKNTDAVSKGISRRMFISMSEDSLHAKQVSVQSAEKIIADAKSKFNQISLKCPGAVCAQIGNNGRIVDSILGDIQNLKIFELEYKLNQNGEFTTFTLLEE